MLTKHRFLKRRFLALFILALLPALACGLPGGLGQSESNLPYILGETILEESFRTENVWETFDLGAGFRAGVVNETFQMENDESGFLWALNDQLHDDAVMEVTAEWLSGPKLNGYGLMCRADTSNNGDGYYFMIGNDGTAAIMKGKDDNINRLVEWARSRSIRANQPNQIRAVCIGDYLALYINGALFAETRDSEYTSGYAGFSVVSYEEEGIPVVVAFDDLTIWAATAR
jgi:hypothetical protein